MGHVDAVKLRTRCRTDVDSSEPDGSTPLLCAISEQHRIIVKLLVEAGADSGSKGVRSDTILSIAAIRARGCSLNDHWG
jgi:ankyrin repeat protein